MAFRGTILHFIICADAQDGSSCLLVVLSAPGSSWPRGSSWPSWLLLALRALLALLALLALAVCFSWDLLALPGTSWLLLGALLLSLPGPPGSSWLLLAPPGPPWLLLALLAPPGSS